MNAAALRISRRVGIDRPRLGLKTCGRRYQTLDYLAGGIDYRSQQILADRIDSCAPVGCSTTSRDRPRPGPIRLSRVLSPLNHSTWARATTSREVQLRRISH